ncbi:MAG: pyroglutamyl-peptidase I, partial [Bacillota bacterium]
GFGASAGEKTSPALTAVRALEGKVGGFAQIVAYGFPAVSGKSAAAVTAAIEREQPFLVISVGPQAGISEIHVERTAVNRDDSLAPCSGAEQPAAKAIIEGAPAAYSATIPVERIVQKLRENGIPASVSDSAGTPMGNHAMFTVLHYIASRKLPAKAGFIHFPHPGEQASPPMSVETIKNAVSLAVQACFED